MGKKKNRRLEFLKLIPPDVKKVLDVGCGNGNLSAHLRERGIEVVGIDRDEKVRAEATKNLNKIIIGDIENLELPYPQGYFDCIIYADVLDCLIDPWALLKKHRNYLSEGGYVIASMANIRYYKALIRLVLGGTWDYMEPGGILWKHHLRFFTLINTRELFTGAGYRIEELQRYIVAARGFKFWNFLLLGSLKEFLTYQYYLRCRKVSGELLSVVGERKVYRF